MEWLIWFAAVAIIAYCNWLIIRTGRPERPERAKPAPPVKAPPAPTPQMPAYIRRWGYSRKAEAAREKADWIAEFGRIAPDVLPPRPPKPEPPKTRSASEVFADLRGKLDNLAS
jgi:hypothetical protein